MVSTRDFDAPEAEKPAPVEEPAPEPPAPDPKEVNAASIRTLDSIDWK
jgi:hypothetical protein